MRDKRPALILVLFIGLLAGFYLVCGDTTPAQGDSASPSPSPTVSPSPTIPPVNNHLWAKHWAKRAAHNQRALKKLSRCLSRPLPRLAERPKATASDAAWSRYGRRCKAKAHKFVEMRKDWAKDWHKMQSDPVALGKVLAKKLYGWTGAQWTALYILWNRESGWRIHPDQSVNGPYGIPQANPGTKMWTAGPDWRTSIKTQIIWGLRYIKCRWGCPTSALANSYACNWY